LPPNTPSYRMPSSAATPSPPTRSVPPHTPASRSESSPMAASLHTPEHELRRYCIECGIKLGYYKPGQYIQRRVGRKVWICSCLGIQQYGTLNCQTCGNYCPFAPRDRKGR
jgi:hypothetical protein